MRHISLLALAVVCMSCGHVSAQQAQAAGRNPFPTMMEMTFPEFEAAVAKTDVVLLPIGAIEEHGPHLPLSTDALGATAFLVEVQRSLRDRNIETIVGPPLNIGITNEASDWSRDGTYIYPGSLTVSADTFVALYVDVVRSLRDNGVRRVFLWSGHGGARHLTAVARIAKEATDAVEGVDVRAVIASENVDRVGGGPNPQLLRIEGLRNFDLLTRLLGSGAEAPTSTHADGVETSLMLHWHPALVRDGYAQLEAVTSSQFFNANRSGNRSENPSGTGGFPFSRASPAVGKEIVDERVRRVSQAIAVAISE